MPNSSDAHDYDLSAIEAAVKETARGRAFLASYARRVRQSDTLTMLAMIACLERWCEGQAARFAELGGDVPLASGATRPNLALDHPDGSFGQSIGRDEILSVAGFDNLAEEIGDPRTIVDIRPSDCSQVGLPGGDPNRTAMRRLEGLATALSELDQRAAKFSSRPQAEVVPENTVDIPWSSATPQMVARPDSLPTQTFNRPQSGASEQFVLDNIAKALGAVR